MVLVCGLCVAREAVDVARGEGEEGGDREGGDADERVRDVHEEAVHEQLQEGERRFVRVRGRA